MRPDEMFQKDNPDKVSDEECRTQWEQARGELLGLALHLERTQGQITARQIRMAVQMADEMWPKIIKRLGLLNERREM
jgi:hypothetical protein